MPKRSRSKQGKKLDLNELAASITNEATDNTPPEETEPEGEGKNPAAVALGRLGGLKGGKARAAKLTKSQRSESARKAARARWKSKQV
jgi:hypothetical protein